MRRQRNGTSGNGSARVESLDMAVRAAHRRLTNARFRGEDAERLRALTEKTVAAHVNWREVARGAHEARAT